MNHSEDDCYQDGIRLPLATDQSEQLKRHFEACTLLGEAQGMLNGIVWSVQFQNDEHKKLAENNVKRWADKVEKFMEMTE